VEEEDCEFKASLGYVASPRLTRTTIAGLCLKKTKRKLKERKKNAWPGVVVHTYNSSTQEGRAGL
jgi:hypothetical protein